MSDAYLTLEELAAYSRISKRQLRRLIRERGLPVSRRNGRRPIIARAEFDAWWAEESRARARKPPARTGRTMREIATEVRQRARA